MLARAGFDVWVGNNRGNKNSRQHAWMKTSKPEYWEFDFEEMGLYDQPANIDFILANTGANKIDAYIGHSMGTTQVFAGASLIPDYYKEKVNLFVALAPVA